MGIGVMRRVAFAFHFLRRRGWPPLPGRGGPEHRSARRDRLLASGSRFLAVREAEWPHRPRVLGERAFAVL